MSKMVMNLNENLNNFLESFEGKLDIAKLKALFALKNV